LDQAKAFGKEITERSAIITDKDSDLIPVPGPVSSDEWIQESKVMSEEAIKQFLPKFSINRETCVRCHECEKNCPVQGIDIEAEPPRIQDPCIYCWRCVTICPTLSVEADWEQLVAMAPQNYARYKKELDRVAARGEFRWLIDPGSIVFDDPLYKQRQREIKSKHSGSININFEPVRSD
jgi:Fe-S-cluster-containing hydrogenase component 2